MATVLLLGGYLEDGLSYELIGFNNNSHHRWLYQDRNAALDCLVHTRSPLSSFFLSERKLYLKAQYPAFFNSQPMRIVRKLRRLAHL